MGVALPVGRGVAVGLGVGVGVPDEVEVGVGVGVLVTAGNTTRKGCHSWVTVLKATPTMTLPSSETPVAAYSNQLSRPITPRDCSSVLRSRMPVFAVHQNA